MSATPNAPCLLYPFFGSRWSDPQVLNLSRGGGSERLGDTEHHPIPLPIEVGDIRLRSFEMPNPGKPELEEREQISFAAGPVSALDVSRPGLLDQLDHRVRHRNVVEFL